MQVVMLIHSSESAVRRARRYRAEIAKSPEDVRGAQNLRYRVFAMEMGAYLKGAEEELDRDELDEHCEHLLVRDLETHRIVACTRLLTDTKARRLGYFYSETEFHLGDVLALPGRHLEIGRTCVDPLHRGSVVLATLWGGLAQFVSANGFDYLMGCASIPPGPSGFDVEGLAEECRQDLSETANLGVRPRIEVPREQRSSQPGAPIPPLLQAYLRLGCRVLGEPAFDADFNVMDVFILLKLDQLQARYERRFISGTPTEKHEPLARIA